MRTSIISIFYLLTVSFTYGQDDLHLPPVLQFTNGSEVKTVKDWRKRRASILSVFEHEVYGVSPRLPKCVRYSIQSENNNALKGKATMKRVNLYLKNMSNPLELLIYYPNNRAKKVPAFLGLNFWGNYTVTDDKDVPMTSLWVPNKGEIKDNKSMEAMRGVRANRWPVEMIVDAGYAVVTLYAGDIDPDYDDGLSNRVQSLYNNEKYTWGSIASWAWGLRYVMNYLEKDLRIDAEKVAVIGHSRLGKAALWAGATDERFALTISNNSGCAGAAISRRKVGETFTVINNYFPYWFCPNFKKYNDKEETLVVDQHLLLAMMAPRPVYVASAELDTWADPEGEFLSAFLAGDAYRIYGLKGIKENKMPPTENPILDGYVGYHIRKGEHNITTYDWQQYINFANRHF